MDFKYVQTIILISVNILNKYCRALDELRTKNNYDFPIIDSVFDDFIFKPNVPQEIRYDSTNNCKLKFGQCHLKSPVAKKNPWITLESYCSVNHEKQANVEFIQLEDRKGKQSKIEDFHNLTSNIGEVRELALYCTTKPLLNKDIDTFVRASIDYPTSVVTNAVLLTPQPVGEFIGSQLLLLSISIHSAEDGLMKKYRSVNASLNFSHFQMIQERKRHYNAGHPSVFLSYAITSGNTSHLEELIETASTYGIDGINGSRMMPRNDYFQERSPTDEEVSRG